MSEGTDIAPTELSAESVHAPEKSALQSDLVRFHEILSAYRAGDIRVTIKMLQAVLNSIILNDLRENDHIPTVDAVYDLFWKSKETEQRIREISEFNSKNKRIAAYAALHTRVTMLVISRLDAKVSAIANSTEKTISW